MWDYQLSAVYTVAILDFVFEEDKNSNEIMHFVQLKDQENQVFYEKLTFIYLEMPKFSKTESELETDFDKWMFVFQNLDKLDKMPARVQGKIFEKLFGEAEVAKLKPKDKEAYEESLKVYRDLKAVTDTAYEDGYKEAEIAYTLKLVEAQRQKEEAQRQKEEANKQKEDELIRRIAAQEKQKEAIKLLLLTGLSKAQIAEKLNLSMEYLDSIDN